VGGVKSQNQHPGLVRHIASWPVTLERIRFAALKLSNGDICELKRAILEAKKGLLMAAYFGYDVTVHHDWLLSNAEGM
jgi:hypothetical protein